VLGGSVALVLALGSIGAGAAFGAFTEDHEQVLVHYNVFSDANAKCGRGSHVNFGGFKTDTKVPFGSGAVVWPATMAPKGNDTNQWSTVATTYSAVYQSKLTSIAYCKAGKEPKVVRHTQVVLQSAANDQFRNVSVSCPRGKNVIGGGWSAKAPEATGLNGQNRLNIMGLKRTSNRAWQVSVINETRTSQRVTAIALCGKGGAPRTSVATVNFPSRDSTSKTATATCPGNTEVVFGGFKGDYDTLSGRNAFIFSFYRSSKKAISVRGGHNYLYGNTQSPKLQAIAYCR
jgi:hypothetical protein